LKVALSATGRVLVNPDDTGRLYARIARLSRDSTRRSATVAVKVT